MKKPRILVLGFDGLDYELYKGFHRHGFTVLPSYSPVPVTGPAWTSLYTGMSFSRHLVREVWGRHDHERFSSNWLVNYLGWRVRDLAIMVGAVKKTGHYDRAFVPYLWDILGERGITVKLFNLPVTWPARKVNGIHVCGIPFNPRGPFCWPREVREKLPANYYEISDTEHWFIRSWRDKPVAMMKSMPKVGFEESLRKTREHSFLLADTFLSLGSADFEMIQFPFVDRFGHVFGVEPYLNELYGLVEDLVGHLAEKSGCENLVIVSDHGFQGKDKHTFVGVMAFRGPLFADAARVTGKVNVRDFAPTVLEAYGIPHGCEGSALSELVLRDGDVVNPDLDEAEKAEYMKMRGHLEKIGYF